MKCCLYNAKSTVIHKTNELLPIPGYVNNNTQKCPYQGSLTIIYRTNEKMPIIGLINTNTQK